jgi:hypothetical protein
MTASYDYVTLTLEPGRKAWTDVTQHLRGIAGTSVLGLFQGQLGFSSNAAVVLLRAAPRDLVQGLARAPGVVALQAETLMPTVRPADGKMLKSGGIYVHRWFTVDADRVDDFVALSNRAWENFEGSFDTEIFGLFTAAPSADDSRDGRLLLLTWYASHGVWEASRDQTRDPDGLFVKRHALTRSTVGRSTLSVPLGS